MKIKLLIRMEIKYIDSERKTSFVGEGREIDAVRWVLKQFNKDYGRNIVISDVIRYWTQKFNDDIVFRESTLNEFKPRNERVDADEALDNVLG